MKEIKSILKNIAGTFIFFFIGYILFTLLKVLSYIIVHEVEIYLLLQTINMILWGIFLCFIVNRNTLSHKLVSKKKSCEYCRCLAVQLISWITIFIVMYINEVKYNFLDHFANYISNFFDLSHDVSFFIYVVIVPDAITFMFVTVMGLAYVIKKYLFDKSTVY